VLNDLNPQWNESFKVELCHWGANLNFEVRDKDHAYTEYIGMVQIPASDLISSGISGKYCMLIHYNCITFKLD
jgi:Ca2+-dependent lipid-binding protein